MRGWKAISFEQFKEACENHMWDNKKNFDVCRRGFEASNHLQCCATLCLMWSKLGRADIKVSKITANNSG